MRLAYLLILTVAAVFGQAVLHDFVFDDFAIFSGELWRPPYTRPLTLLSFRIDLATNVAVGHAVNVALHAINSLLVLDVLRRFIPLPAAQVAAVIFALHPLQVEPVNYIWARSTLLMTMFCLLSMRTHGWRTAAWFALALLSKNEAVAFPVFLLLLPGFSRRVIAAMLAMSAGVGAYTWWAANTVEGSQAGAQAIYSPLTYLATQGLVILRYLQLLVLPTGPFTIEPSIPLGQAWAWLGVIVIAVAALKWRPAVWLLGGIILLLPSSSVFPANDLAADRRMYLPMISFAAAIGLIPALQRRYVLTGIGLVLAVMSAVQSRHWRSEMALWTHVLEHNSRSVRARVHIARASQRPEIPLLLEAKNLAPDDPLVASELGRAYLEQKRIPEALSEFGRALALEPRNAFAMANRGVALLMLGQREAARADFERALKTDPCVFGARHNLRQMGFDPDPPPAHCREAR